MKLCFHGIARQGGLEHINKHNSHFSALPKTPWVPSRTTKRFSREKRPLVNSRESPAHVELDAVFDAVDRGVGPDVRPTRICAAGKPRRCRTREWCASRRPGPESLYFREVMCTAHKTQVLHASQQQRTKHVVCVVACSFFVL